MIEGNSENVYTLDNFIQEYGAEDLRVDAFHLKEVFFNPGMRHKIVVNGDNISDKYASELEENKRTITLSTKEYYKYRYNPKLLSYDIYGTTELWFFILMANELYSITEFDLRKLVLYDASIISKFNKMLELDQEFLEINSMEVMEQTQSGGTV